MNKAIAVVVHYTLSNQSGPRKIEAIIIFFSKEKDFYAIIGIYLLFNVNIHT